MPPPRAPTMWWHVLLALLLPPRLVHGANSTFDNPILPGFHPDPSCIFVREWNETFFCASSSFSAFPGIPIHASKDLTNWKLIGNVLNREEQLPQLADTNSSTSGIWAPTIRYHDGTFWVVTTLVFDDARPVDDPTRWDNIIFRADDPYDPSSWSAAAHFGFFGYDPSPFWDDDGRSYVVASHYWRVRPGLALAEVDLATGEVLGGAGGWRWLWDGAGGHAPEGPHLYRHDGWYYLAAAEGGTGVGHMVTVARARSLGGPYEPDPANPVLTAAKTSAYFQTVGHADLFRDASDNWWGVALATRSGPAHAHYPMGRETVLTAVSWPDGAFPAWTPVAGRESGWALPPADRDGVGGGPGPFIDDGDDVDFAPGSALPAHFTHWRFPDPSAFAVVPDGEDPHARALRVRPSAQNLTGPHDEDRRLAFVGRRQQHTLFTFRATLDYAPAAAGEEAGVTAFLTQDHHLDLGVVLLPAAPAADGTTALVPQIRYRGISSSAAVPAPVVAPVPDDWLGRPLTFEIKAANGTHFSLSVGPAGADSQMQTVVYVSNAALSYGFTGTFLGIYCTSNGGNGTAPAYFSDWKYIPQGQYLD